FRSESDIEGRLDWSQQSEREHKGSSGEFEAPQPPAIIFVARGHYGLFQ
ncbi:hypothetical protein V498_01281, partial [Pseudogymnoascus sp. VKM F-4517 (FW-2822)]